MEFSSSNLASIEFGVSSIGVNGTQRGQLGRPDDWLGRVAVGACGPRARG